MEKLKFFMAMNPPTATEQQQHFNKKTGKVYKATEVKAARAKLMAHLAEHKPEKPFTGPTAVTFSWLYYNPDKPNMAWHISKPDLDNIEKGLQDCMTKLGFWTDDKIICMKISQKRWTNKVPGILIEVEEAPNE